MRDHEWEPALMSGHSQRTGAVIVTFRPSSEEVRQIAFTQAQFDRLVLVDNGSDVNAIRELERLAIENNLQFIPNERNIGIAAALNQGVKYLLSIQVSWIFLLDQDSIPSEGFVSQMMEDFRSLLPKRPIVQMVPRYVDPVNRKRVHVPPLDEDGGPFLTITSGSLFSAKCFRECGFFDEKLFLYCVDDDYSLRIRAKGWSIGESERAELFHHSGNSVSRILLGKEISSKNYRALSRYYFARNKVWMLRSWGRRFPRIIIPTLRQFVSIPMKIAIVEESRTEKIWMFLKGIVHGIMARSGPYPSSRY